MSRHVFRPPTIVYQTPPKVLATSSEEPPIGDVIRQQTQRHINLNVFAPVTLTEPIIHYLTINYVIPPPFVAPADPPPIGNFPQYMRMLAQLTHRPIKLLTYIIEVGVTPDQIELPTIDPTLVQKLATVPYFHEPPHFTAAMRSAIFGARILPQTPVFIPPPPTGTPLIDQINTLTSLIYRAPDLGVLHHLTNVKRLLPVSSETPPLGNVTQTNLNYLTRFVYPPARRSEEPFLDVKILAEAAAPPIPLGDILRAYTHRIITDYTRELRLPYEFYELLTRQNLLAQSVNAPVSDVLRRALEQFISVTYVEPRLSDVIVRSITGKLVIPVTFLPPNIGMILVSDEFSTMPIATDESSIIGTGG